MSFHSSKWPPLRKKNNFRNYVIFCLQIFKFCIIVAVKSISGIKGGNMLSGLVQYIVLGVAPAFHVIIIIIN